MIKEPGQFNPPAENNQNTKNAEAEKPNQEKPIEVDPEFLEHIRSLKPKGEHQKELTNVRFAATIISHEMYDLIYDALKKTDLKTIRQNLTKYKNELKSFSGELEELENGDIIEEEFLVYFTDYLFSILPIDNTLRENHLLDLLEGLMPQFDDNGKIILKERDEIEDFSGLINIMKKYLKDETVVDLGAGREDFLWEASKIGAKEYIAIDNPNGDGKEIQGSTELPPELKIFDIDLNVCPNKYISSDILEGIYTKIPDNSSSFVIFGVEQSYNISDEYIKLTNKLIAEKTKVGGIIVCVASTIGWNMPDNFEKNGQTMELKVKK